MAAANVFESVDPSLRDVDFGSLTITDTMEQLARLRDSGQQVAPIRFHNEVGWVVVGYAAVCDAFMNEAQLPAAAFYQQYTMPWLGRTIPSMRAQEHRIHRAFFGAPLFPARIRARIQDVLVPVANDLINSFGTRRELDFMASFAALYPFRVITRLFDLPDADNEAIRERVHALFRFPWDPEGAARARDEMIEYLRPIALQRRQSPGEDIVSYLASTPVGGKLLDEGDLIDLIRFMYPAAGENTTNALGLLLYRVSFDDTIRQRVLNSEADRAAAVEESLRLDPPVPLITRYADHAVTLSGVTIPAGSPVLFGIGAANRDPSRFEQAETFSLDRGITEHITFGRGVHFCLGAHLARAELRTMLNLMLDRLPGLRLSSPGNVRIQGALQRGPAELRIAFDELLPERGSD